MEKPNLIARLVWSWWRRPASTGPHPADDTATGPCLLDPKPALSAELRSTELRATTIRDEYGYFHRASQLATTIAATAAPPSTIGVFAEWGRGKSTLLNTVEFILTESQRTGFKGLTPLDTTVLVLRYRPWLFRLDDFDDVWLSMIEDMRQQLKKRYDRRALGGWKKEPVKVFLEKTLGARLLRISDRLLRLAAGLDVKILKSVSAKINKAGSRNDLGKPMYDFFAENRTALANLVKAHGRVLLIVDDLDRCDPAIAIEILRAVHVFARTDNLVCLIAMDRDVIISTLKKRFGRDANEFLHKIIQVAVTPPRINLESARRRIGDMLAGSFGGTPGLPEWVEFASSSLLYNPRSFEKFEHIFRFRDAVVPKEIGVTAKYDVRMTVAQAIIAGPRTWTENYCDVGAVSGASSTSRSSVPG